MQNKKKLLLLGGIAVVVCVLVAVAFVFGRKGAVGDGAQQPDSDKEVTSEADQTEEEKVEMTAYEDGSYPLEQAMAQVSGYDAVYNSLAEYFQTMYTGGSTGFVDGAALPDVEEQKAIVFTEIMDYSDAKEDLYVTDGSYAYMVKKDNSLSIVKLEGTMQIQSVISGYEHEGEYVTDLLVEGDRLILMTSYTSTQEDDPGTLRYSTMIYTYNIADRTQPALIGSVEMEGYYMGSRMTDSGFYVYTGCHKDGFVSPEGTLVAAEELAVSDYVPSVNGEVIPAESVYMPQKVTENYYFTVALIDTESPEAPKQVKTFLSADSQYYAGEHGLFLILQNGLYQVSSTVIVRLDFADGEIGLTSAGAVSGTIVGNNGLSEKDGLLQVVSSVHSGDEPENYLYVLDAQFKIAAKYDSIAEGELIQSVRFIDNQLYLATYGDLPIVRVDLSDIYGIKEMALAKPEGFDGLLCAFGENQILGISYIVNDTTMAYEGVRLTMFDVSDASAISVADTLDIQTDTTPVATDPSALFLDMEQGLIGLSTEDWDEGYTHVENVYRVCSYTKETGFVSMLDAQLSQGNCWKSRGFASGTMFYVSDQDAGLLKCFDRTNGFAQTGEINY